MCPVVYVLYTSVTMECHKITLLSFKQHCTVAFLIRLILIVYSRFHDEFFTVPYTDVDYKVFTDAARYMVEGKSPFERHTYRYTPGLALLLVPNIFLSYQFGKIMFSFVDLMVASLIRNILKQQGCTEKAAQVSALLWLYNPLTIVISTRGNADSIAVLFVMLTLCFLQRNHYVLAGLIHGLSVHFRLYPVVFSMPMYLSLSTSSYLIPNTHQMKLAGSSAFSLIFLTFVSYYFYGYQYLYESIIYHLIRKDTRHNFSVYFYMLYLSANNAASVIQKLFTLLPQVLLLLGLSFRYSSKSNLPFAMFTQAMVMVTYNPVLTSQYFFWFLSLLPLSVSRIRLSGLRTLCLSIGWVVSQALWLLAAYSLEFLSVNSFLYIWFASLLFFIVNIKILEDILVHYK